MKKYIDLNTEKMILKNAANYFENDFFKFCLWQNNKKFSKKNKCAISEQWKRFLKYPSTPTVVTHRIFDKNFAAIHETKLVLRLNKPIFVGFTVLELSKWLMYDFHYNFIKKILMLNYCLLTQTALLMK